MITINLKYQLRQGLFIVPAIVIPLFLATDNVAIIFFLLQARFFKVFQQSDFQTTLIHLSGNKLAQTLYNYNLSWAIWFNSWLIIALLISYWVDSTLQNASTMLVDFNILLFISFVIGNTISNSDIILIKQSLVRMLAASFIFGLTVGFSSLILMALTKFNISIFIHLFFLAGVVFFWKHHTRQQKQIKYIHFYL